ncbi:MAG: dynamin family protein, partial [Micromonosporaceae bacterium]|nr:dynamin family protein [Micromonosporaceae bacterium]
MRYPLAVPSAAAATQASRRLAGQIDDYLFARASRMDAPMLVVVGGPTGAGKSTLVNSLVRAPVTPAGVLRPTTRAPVLVSNPAD